VEAGWGAEAGSIAEHAGFHLAPFAICVIFCVMKAASVYDVQHHFSRVLRWVATGETVVISRHRVPVAKLVPAKAKNKSVAVAMPDFMTRLKKNYGGSPLPDSQPVLDELREDRY